MSPTPLRTDRLELVFKSRADVLEMIETMPPEVKAEFSEDWLSLVRSSGDLDPWVHGFTAVGQESGAAVGMGAFKGPPADGMVEIAYAVDEEHRGKGLATEIAAALVDFAFQHSEVDFVRAHTLPDGAASQRILVKCGFQPVGEVMDPEDGLVRRFEKRRSS
jgi:RimJ/RimL family protein N-acetyltransferase